MLSGSEDKIIKIWDRNTGKVVGKMQYGNMPFYSIDTNQQIICAGTNEDIIFWDVRNLKNPLEVLDESHSDDVTCVKFHPKDNQ